MSTLIELPSGLSNVAAINTYLYKLTEQLNYVLNNLDTENFTEDAKSTLTAGNSVDVKILEMTEEQRELLQNYRDSLLQEIINSANVITSDTTTALQQNAEDIKSLVATLYVARTEGDDTSTVAELKQYTSSLVTQTDQSIRLDFSTVEEVATNTAEELQNYINDNNTYIRFSEEGIEVGKKIDDSSVPYSVLITNEKMSFMSNGVEVAYIQYNKLFITQAEIVNRLSIGSETNGYLDIITTATGVGFKWREVT